MACPYLEYREDDDRVFDEARAYCTAAGEFVQPMRADICNDRYDLDHSTDCEIYREAEDGAESEDQGAGTDASGAGIEGGEP